MVVEEEEEEEEEAGGWLVGDERGEVKVCV